MTWVTRDPI